MKKTYISPATTIVNIVHHQMIAESILVGNNYDGETTIEVKEERLPSYNVWDDDWSK